MSYSNDLHRNTLVRLTLMQISAHPYTDRPRNWIVVDETACNVLFSQHVMFVNEVETLKPD